jgi:hypothetical protein
LQEVNSILDSSSATISDPLSGYRANLSSQMASQSVETRLAVVSENEIHVEGPSKRPILSRTRTVVHVNQAEAALSKVDEFDDKSLSDGSSPSSSTDIPALENDKQKIVIHSVFTIRVLGI